jgi:hypothetical protein
MKLTPLIKIIIVSLSGLCQRFAEFETADPSLKGEMIIKVTLTDAGGGTDIIAMHEGLPPGLSQADNEVGWREALAKLAAPVEAD